MLAAVGSTNPVKLAAVKAILHRLTGDPIEVVAISVDSGIPAQPWGDIETRRGAINRAVAAQAGAAADWGFGLEGGLLELTNADGSVDLYTSAWCAVADRSGALGVAGGANMLLPPSVAAAVRSGVELGQAIDALTGQQDTHHRGGAIGALCHGLTDRQTAFEQVLSLAFAPILSPHTYTQEA